MKYELEKNIVIKNDPNGNVTCLNKLNNLIIVANNTVATIINLPGVHTSDEVVALLEEKYGVGNSDDLIKDVNETLYKLDVFQIVHIISEDICPTAKKDFFIGDSSYRRVSKFCQDNIRTHGVYDASFGKPEYYSIYNLRVRCFNGFEYGICLTNDAVDIEAVALFGITSSPSVLILDSFIFKENNASCISEYFKRVSKVLKSVMPVSKIRIFVLEDDNYTSIDVYKQIGFEKEFVMKKELNNKDLISYFLMI